MKRKRNLMRMILPLAFAMAMLTGMTVTANAETVKGVRYLYFENEAAAIAGTTTQGTHDCERVESSSASYVYWGKGDETTWLVVDGNATISNQIIAKGAVNLILADGAALNANRGITVTDGGKLNIYAQSTGDNAGKLVTSTQGENCGVAVYDNSSLTINGGKVDASGTLWGIGDFDPRASSKTSVVTINGGTVTAKSSTATEDGDQMYSGILAGKSLKVNGGEVTAEWTGTGSNKYGIYSEGSLTVNGGKVTADGPAPGRAGISTDGKLIVTGGEIYASCRQTEPVANDTCGIYADGGMEVTDGKITALGGVFGIQSTGYYEGETVTIKGGTIDATGTGAGLYSQKLLTIEGGKINATATRRDGDGISSYDNIMISGGDVRTTGGDTGIRVLHEQCTLTISGGNVVTSGSACIGAEKIVIGDALMVRAGEKEPGDYVDRTEFQATAGRYEWAKIGKQVTRNVKFFVANGAWNDGTKNGRTAAMTGFEDEMILTADLIPAVGSKPDSGYKAGSWDVTPVAGTLITENTTYKYTYAKKDTPTPTPEPTPTPKPTPSKKTAKTVVVAKAIASGKTKAKLSWNDAGADRYVIYRGICGKNMKKYKTVNGKTRKLTVSKLRSGEKYRFCVVAQKKSGKSYRTIATSGDAHMAAGNVSGSYTNVKDLKVNRKAVNLKKGRSFRIKTGLTKVRKDKRLLNSSHDKSVRFTTTDPGVAVVNSKGKITAKGKGSCRVYVQAVNGLWKTVRVTVK